MSTHNMSASCFRRLLLQCCLSWIHFTDVNVHCFHLIYDQPGHISKSTPDLEFFQNSSRVNLIWRLLRQEKSTQYLYNFEQHFNVIWTPDLLKLFTYMTYVSYAGRGKYFIVEFTHSVWRWKLFLEALLFTFKCISTTKRNQFGISLNFVVSSGVIGNRLLFSWCNMSRGNWISVIIRWTLWSKS